MSEEKLKLKPDYEGKCITKIPGTLKSLLGLDNGYTLLDGKSDKVLLIVVDSLGYENLMEIFERDKELREILSRFELDKITSVFPTSTAPAMTSIESGKPPEKHSLLEWVAYSRELNMRFYTLKFQTVDEENKYKFERKADEGLIEHRDMFNDLVKEGVQVHQINPEDLVDSEFSEAGNEQKEGYSNLVEAFVKTRELIEKEEDKSLFSLYLPHFDTSSHDNGPYSEESTSLLREIFTLINREIIEELENLRIVIAADHGCVKVKNTIEIEKDNELGREIFPNLKTYYGKKILPVGGSRNMYLHVEEGKLEDVIENLRRKLNGKARVFRTEELIEGKLFGTGEPSQKFSDSIGNVVVLPEKNTMMHFDPFTEEYKGMHGGLTEEELYVPLLSMEV